MRQRSGASWFVYTLAALVLGAIVAAVLVVGPASGGQAANVTRTVTAQRGVVQSTVSGSGNIQAASELDLGFKTSGTVTQIDVAQGERVGKGQLLATLDPQSAEVTLEQAKASLQSAEAALAREEETNGESSSQGSTGSGSGAGNASASAASIASPASRETAGETTKRASAKRTGGGSGSGTSSGSGSGSGSGASSNGSSPASSSSGSSSSSSSTTTISSATREANIASAKAAVKSDRLTVKSAEQSVADTRLVAPENGTIVSLSGEVGETVSGGGTSKASTSSESSSASTGSSGAGGLGASAAGSSGSGSSGSSGSSSSSFAVLSDLSKMKLVVPLSESEIGDVKVGQPATVTIEALKSAKVAAHVSEVAALPTSNSGVVSYDVTFALDQLESGLKAGMSATAEVVVAQAEGVNVPTSAISGGSVTVIANGKQERRAVTSGLAGDSSTIVHSGLKAGERVVLLVASTSGTSSLLSRLAGRSTSGTLGGAGGGFAGGGFAGGAFARGGAGRAGPGG
jgi:multidrug efflux pump subunit AcrA (membrane-fusion protein)